jgi:serine/threonine protein phosphatase 1
MVIKMANQKSGTKRFVTTPQNESGRDFIVGDLHGTYKLLRQAMAEVFFDPNVDRIFSVGDLVDRGVDSAECLDYLRQPWFHAVRGNHEDIWIQIFRHNPPNGHIAQNICDLSGSYGLEWGSKLWQEDPQRLRAIVAEFEQLPVARQIETPSGPVGVVHADLPQGMGWKDFATHLKAGNDAVVVHALWSRERIKARRMDGIDGIGLVFVGHTPVVQNPQLLGNVCYIDTGAIYSGGTLTMLNIQEFAAKVLGPAVHMGAEASPQIPAARPRESGMAAENPGLH